MKRVTKVTIRTFGDCPMARCIWEEDGNSALVCLEEEFQEWRTGGRQPLTVSLPKTHIYKYEHALFDNLASLYRRVRETDKVSSVTVLRSQLEGLWLKATPLFPDIAKENAQVKMPKMMVKQC